jgi:hypothetical protein
MVRGLSVFWANAGKVKDRRRRLRLRLRLRLRIRIIFIQWFERKL